MKHFNGLCIFITLLLISISNVAICQSYTDKIEFTKSKKSLMDPLDAIKICKWKNDARTCINFSFDDNYISHRKISQLFDKYNFKATFFVISDGMIVDTLIDMSKRGHEIGNHTFWHYFLPSLDSSDVAFQLHKGKEMIENAIGVKCVSLAEPGNQFNELTNKIAMKYHLFFRNHSEYADISHRLFNCEAGNMNQLKGQIDASILDGRILEIAAHAIDGEGYMPLTKDLLVQALDLINSYSKTGEVWVSTVKDGIGYEDLYHETKLVKSQIGDTLKLDILNYNDEKYKDMIASPITIEIPKSISKKITCLSNYVEIKELENKFLVTLDLKRETSLQVVLL